MKTGDLILIGGAVALGYYLAKRQDPAQAQAAAARQVVAPPQAAPAPGVYVEEDYTVPGWNWGPSFLVGGRRGGHGHGGHGHHGGHH